MTKVYIENKPDKEFYNRVKDLLLQKHHSNMIPFTEDNKTNLGNVTFWFKSDTQKKEVYLIYTLPVEEWNIDAMKNDMYVLDEQLNRRYVGGLNGW